MPAYARQMHNLSTLQHCPLSGLAIARVRCDVAGHEEMPHPYSHPCPHQVPCACPSLFIPRLPPVHSLRLLLFPPDSGCPDLSLTVSFHLCLSSIHLLPACLPDCLTAGRPACLCACLRKGARTDARVCASALVRWCVGMRVLARLLTRLETSAVCLGARVLACTQG